jgi:hypothetical protein
MKKGRQMEIVCCGLVDYWGEFPFLKSILSNMNKKETSQLGGWDVSQNT